jgi:hypothetical protein
MTVTFGSALVGSLISFFSRHIYHKAITYLLSLGMLDLVPISDVSRRLPALEWCKQSIAIIFYLVVYCTVNIQNKDISQQYHNDTANNRCKDLKKRE